MLVKQQAMHMTTVRNIQKPIVDLRDCDIFIPLLVREGGIFFLLVRVGDFYFLKKFRCSQVS